MLKCAWILLRSAPRFQTIEPERRTLLLGNIVDGERSLTAPQADQRQRHAGNTPLAPHDTDVPCGLKIAWFPPCMTPLPLITTPLPCSSADRAGGPAAACRRAASGQCVRRTATRLRNAGRRRDGLGVLRVSGRVRWGGVVWHGPVPRIHNVVFQALLSGAEAGVCAGVQEPEIADFLPPCGQDVLHEAADELERRQRHGLPGLVVRRVAERDRAALHGASRRFDSATREIYGVRYFRAVRPSPTALQCPDQVVVQGDDGIGANSSGATALRASRNVARKTVRKAEPGTRNFGCEGIHSPVVGSMPPPGTRSWTCR